MERLSAEEGHRFIRSRSRVLISRWWIGRGPSLHQIHQREIRTRERTPAAERQAQSLGRKVVVASEILGQQGSAIARVGYRDICSVRLAREKRFQIAPLTGDFTVQRIVD